MPLLPPTHTERVAAFGLPAYFHDPRPGNPERVQLTGPWVREHLTEVVVPQLAPLGVRSSVTVHYKAKEPLLRLWAAWEAAELLTHVHAWNGLWAPRYKRQNGSIADRLAACAHLGPDALSNHTWATAFDINAQELPLGRPVPPEHPFRLLARIANDLGWAWGGDYRNRPDPMHFELAR